MGVHGVIGLSSRGRAGDENISEITTRGWVYCGGGNNDIDFEFLGGQPDDSRAPSTEDIKIYGPEEGTTKNIHIYVSSRSLKILIICTYFTIKLDVSIFGPYTTLNKIFIQKI